MQDQYEMKNHLKKKSWAKANEWIAQERSLMDSLVTYSRIVTHVCYVPMSMVLAFYSWLIFFPVASEKELAAFPIAGAATAFYDGLCQIAPGGELVVFFGFPLFPLLLGALAGLLFRRRKHKEPVQQPYRLTGIQAAKDIQEKIKALKKAQDRYFSYTLCFPYGLITGLFTGGILMVSAVTGGLNPFGYILWAVGFDIFYFIALALCNLLFVRLFKDKSIQDYPASDWNSIVEDAIDHYESGGRKKKADTYVPANRSIQESEYYKRKYDEYYAMYMGQTPPTETEEERIKRIVRETETDMLGSDHSGYGDCY